MPNSKSKALTGKPQSFALSSKLNPPLIRSDLVRRQSLLEGLVRSQARFTLVVGAAGFGKTSLLSQWYAERQELGEQTVWLNLDGNDAEPLHFISSVMAALSQVEPNLKYLISKYGFGSKSSDLQQAMTVLCQELEATDPKVLLIIDEYHLAQSPILDEVIDQLLLRLPGGIRIALSTRVRPSIALPALLAQGNLLVVDDSQLRFTRSEVGALIGKRLKEGGQVQLLERTKGWPFALQMARILLNDSDELGGDDPSVQVDKLLAGASDSIAHYLTDQVLATLPDALQTFLIETSFLTSICEGLADTVRKRSDSAAMLQEMKPIQTSFVINEGGKRWYSCHPLFREFLFDLLLKQGQQTLQTLRRRAAGWYADNGMVCEAVEQAVLAGDRDLTTALMNAAGGVTLLHTHGINVFTSLMNLIPASWIHRVPMLTLGKAALLAREGKHEEAFEYIKEVKQCAERSQDENLLRDLVYVEVLWTGYADVEMTSQQFDAIEKFSYSDVASSHWLRGWLQSALFLSYYRQGQIAKSQTAVDIAMAHYVDDGAYYSQYYMHLNLGMVKFIQGNLWGALRSYQRATQLVERYFDSSKVLLSLPQLLQAGVYYQLNRVEKAAALVSQALPLVERYDGWPELYIYSYRVAMDVAYQTGGLDAVARIQAGAEATATRRNLSRLRWHLLARQVDLYSLGGELDRAKKLALDESLEAQLLEEGDRIRFAWSERLALSLALARMSLYDGRPKKALQMLGQIPDEEAYRLTAFQLRKLLLAMMAYMELEDTASALDCLEKLMALPHGRAWLRTYLDEGLRLSACLKKLVKDNAVTRLPENVRALIKDIVSLQVKDSGSSKSVDAPSFDLLSLREQEILKELSYGHSNKAIANKLGVSERTIKFHLQNIYGKFGVNSRGQALNVARRYQLI